MNTINPLSKITIPEQLYVGLRPNPDKESIVPFAFMAEIGTTKAAQKNIARVKNYANTAGKKLDPAIVDNIPLMGFKLGGEAIKSRDWSGTSEMVRVADPRGFETDISISNLMLCMTSTIVENGEILDECVWGKIGQQTLLLPTNSEPYLHMLDSQKRISEAIPTRSVKTGEKIKLVTGEEGYYMGKMHSVFTLNSHDIYVPDITVTIHSVKRHVLKMEINEEVVYMGFNDIKIQSILEPLEQSRTKHDVEDEIFQTVKARQAICAMKSNYYYKEIIGWVYSNTKMETSFSYDTVNESTVISLKEFYGDRSYRFPRVYAMSKKGEYLYVGGQYETNFVKPRNDPNRHYNKGRGYYYPNNRVNTTGLIGAPAALQNGSFRCIGSEITHFEEDAIAQYAITTVTIKTKEGTTITRYV